METVYIETTIVSYLVANPSRDLVVAARQAITDEWWREARGTYRCVTSDEVIREASLGDADMSRRRLELLAPLPVLDASEESRRLARELIRAGLLPAAGISDATHVAVATLNRVEVLVTWNCRHLANPHLLRRLRAFMAARGLQLPEICTPLEMEGE
ncbi:MAG: DNA-binding protein [Armatimonadetes bacterium CG_4_10_14_3_um_filter_66_18]|nr:type II toxin-antitoxin system VapC family toxin [Armatimonadota bacterium]OIO93663.1 MAG: hypothetical protein AUJ96_29795 [Armatimonadetes bacterium CG2_30_66_41]PIU92752.1 MAG: DNA-binding protein [Armatimonadetes bacterium CG06_land_8_20_14_3_00_66_21]PIX43903.1 MAG: DNA-binding protein [Armatimonadetes bacterium CG_4_8_14_3_um_filter_66_20]PIY50231.1 MAG: DNA-binding protein [Armatimonadetes bacterium CG_4_10_14_3_um_filter_66_18]PIZ48371.1 MAG: DNA-binding protein [Armatimonadetes bac